MSTWVWIVIAVAAVIVVAAVVWSALRTRRTQSLQEGFGPEYDRTVADAPSKREAEAELDARRKRREQLDIQPLSQSARDRYASQWKDTQARFVDDPEEAVGEADALIQQVMRERGYPVEDFDQRTADVSVDHPDVVNNYRAAHAISVANTRGNATTDDLRQAMVHYRALFVELLDEREPATTEARR
jgi:FtsZ-interacting cell division protein ZipA